METINLPEKTPKWFLALAVVLLLQAVISMGSMIVDQFTVQAEDKFAEHAEFRAADKTLNEAIWSLTKIDTKQNETLRHVIHDQAKFEGSLKEVNDRLRELEREITILKSKSVGTAVN